jgi:hypothetical protein
LVAALVLHSHLPCDVREGAEDVTENQFQKRWKLKLTLAPVLQPYVEGTILAWSAVPPAIDELDRTLLALPGQMIAAAKVNAVLLVEGLTIDTDPADGACSDYDPRRQPGRTSPLVSDRTTWVSLNRSLFGAPAQERFLRVPLLDARVCEEIAHAWDAALEARASRRCSDYTLPGSAWLALASLPGEKPAAFPVPNRKDYDLNPEDWALAVVWYAFHKIALHNISRPHHDFVRDLF